MNEGRTKMFANLFQTGGTMIVAAAIFTLSFGGLATKARGDEPTANAQAETRSPHGGQVTKIESLSLEVVYRPREVRVYLDSLPDLASAKEVTGEMVTQAHGNLPSHRYPLRYVARPAGSKQQCYLAAAVDLSKVRSGDMQVEFNLENLPLPNHSKVTFAQTFALSTAKPQVTLAPLSESDRAGIARQKVCPVTGAVLGSMGDPVKVLVGGEPLYLCCEGCVAKVRSSPEKYLAKARKSADH
jgi:hypothetical protein